MLLKIKRKSEKKPEITDEAEASILPLEKDRLGVSEAAFLQLSTLLTAKEEKDLFFRISIRGGGCSGLSIHYEFTKTQLLGDTIISRPPVNVVIDRKSLSILGGATLHCRTYLGSGEFVLVNNPAAKQCSCGQSFAL